jgi:hypothetical protein
MNESKSVKIEISNNTKKPLLLSLEPWGEDYTLLEQEEVCRSLGRWRK